MKYFVTIAILLYARVLFAQPLLETGGKAMPDEWIDKDTHHKIIKLTRKEGSNYSFYFHNNPFVGNKMVFLQHVATKTIRAGCKS